MINPEADLAEYLTAQSRRELAQHPRTPVVRSTITAPAIDLSALLQMTGDEIDAALCDMQAA